MKASGMIVRGVPIAIPGIEVVNFVDDPRLRLSMQDGKKRARDEVTLLVMHSTLGAPDQDFPHPQTLLEGRGPSTGAGVATNEMWQHDGRCAGAHAVVDHDGVWYQLCDLDTWESYNATSVNDRAIGIELKQGRARSEFYVEEFHSAAVGCDWITAYESCIQRMIPKGYKNRPCKRLEAGAKDFYGVIGHRDQTSRRGAGDPGDLFMAQLASRGYEEVDVDYGEDLELWRARQRWLGLDASEQDGIPGKRTRAFLRGLGFACGLWALPPKNIQIPSSLRPPR